MKALVPALLAGALAAAGCATGPELAAGHRWLEVAGPDFVVRSEVGEEETLEVARRLDRFRAAAHALTGVEPPHGRPPARVYVFESARSFHAYRGYDRRIGGYFLGAPHAAYVAVLAGARGARTFRVAYHEYTHLLLEHSRLDVPLWYNEGLATLLESFRIVEGRAEVGHRNDRFLRELRAAGWRSDPTILDVTLASPEYRGSVPSFHAQAWALAHYFVFGTEERLSQLADYLERWSSGEPSAEALRESFGTDYDGLWREVVGHLTGEHFVYGDFPVASLGEDRRYRAREMAPAEVHAALGDLLIYSGPQGVVQAEPLFRAALAEDPDLALPRAGLSLALDRAGRHAEARRLIDEALDAAPGDVQIRMLAGDHAFRVARHPGGAPPGYGEGDLLPSLQQARFHYGVAAKLDPLTPEIAQRVGMTYLFEPAKRAEGIARLTRAAETWPRHRGLAEILARLHVQAGHEDAARSALARPLRAPPDAPAIALWLAAIRTSPASELDFDTLATRIGRRPDEAPPSRSEAPAAQRPVE